MHLVTILRLVSEQHQQNIHMCMQNLILVGKLLHITSQHGITASEASLNLQVWMDAMEMLHGNVPQLQRHFWAAAYQIALFRDALAIAK
jgi:hypothetical protein